MKRNLIILLSLAIPGLMAPEAARFARRQQQRRSVIREGATHAPFMTLLALTLSLLEALRPSS